MQRLPVTVLSFTGLPLLSRPLSFCFDRLRKAWNGYAAEHAVLTTSAQSSLPPARVSALVAEIMSLSNVAGAPS
jgi:hypothetical protein